jgi:hypothetical protein
MATDDGLVHREVLELRATPAQVRRFVMTPERILDYYAPAPIEAGVFEEGRSIWCRGEMAVTMIELDDDQSDDDRVVILVTTAMGLEPPYTPAQIRAATFFTMYEDWAVAPSPEGATLTKSWRDVNTPTEVDFPLEDSIRETAKTESAPLIERWNEAARREA